MSAPKSEVTSALPALHFLAIGRCTQVRKAGTVLLHLVALPAQDEYSSPSTIEVIATERFASPGDDCRVILRAGGFRRSYRSTDKDTGEVRNVTTADNKFFFVRQG
jgi:hypothetical protein